MPDLGGVPYKAPNGHASHLKSPATRGMKMASCTVRYFTYGNETLWSVYVSSSATQPSVIKCNMYRRKFMRIETGKSASSMRCGWGIGGGIYKLVFYICLARK
jgi:hypothetical protein